MATQSYTVTITALHDPESAFVAAQFLRLVIKERSVEEIRRALLDLPLVLTRDVSLSAAETLSRHLVPKGVTVLIEPSSLSPLQPDPVSAGRGRAEELVELPPEILSPLGSVGPIVSAVPTPSPGNQPLVDVFDPRLAMATGLGIPPFAPPPTLPPVAFVAPPLEVAPSEKTLTGKPLGNPSAPPARASHTTRLSGGGSGSARVDSDTQSAFLPHFELRSESGILSSLAQELPPPRPMPSPEASRDSAAGPARASGAAGGGGEARPAVVAVKPLEQARPATPTGSRAGRSMPLMPPAPVIQVPAPVPAVRRESRGPVGNGPPGAPSAIGGAGNRVEAGQRAVLQGMVSDPATGGSIANAGKRVTVPPVGPSVSSEPVGKVASSGGGTPGSAALPGTTLPAQGGYVKPGNHGVALGTANSAASPGARPPSSRTLEPGARVPPGVMRGSPARPAPAEVPTVVEPPEPREAEAPAETSYAIARPGRADRIHIRPTHTTHIR